MAEIQTVRIEDDGFPEGLIINKEDFDEEKHKIFTHSDIPKDLPGRDALVRAGVAFKDLQKMNDEDLLKVEGIDVSTVAEINKYAESWVNKHAKAEKPLGSGFKTDDDGSGDLTHAGLMKMTKSELLDLAKERGHEFPVPDDVTKEVIANAILDVK